MDTVVLLPAYNPNIMMLKTLRELKALNFGVLVVNDGSSKEFEELFETVPKYATMLSYKQNMGKGYALKFGMENIPRLFPEAKYFITADADGQHSTEDICTIREKLRQGEDFILGTRDFKGNIPLRSWVGNSLSRLNFAVSSGHYLSDNQSGLRGFANCHIPWMLKVSGNRYEYEMNILVCAVKQGIKIHTTDIQTIYIDDNRSSHFNPIRDTWRIHKNIFKCAGGSLISIAASILLVALIEILFGWSLWPIRVHCIGVVCVMLSWVLNRFIWYKNFNFRSDKRLLFSAAIRWVLYDLVILALYTLMPFGSLTVFFAGASVLVMVGEYFTRKAAAHM